MLLPNEAKSFELVLLLGYCCIEVLFFSFSDPEGGISLAPLSRDVSASLSVSSTPAAHRPSEHTRAESRVLL